VDHLTRRENNLRPVCRDLGSQKVTYDLEKARRPTSLGINFGLGNGDAATERSKGGMFSAVMKNQHSPNRPKM
jgi:hypothetical protein